MPASASDLEQYFRANDGPMIHKWHHYFEIYERHFNRFCGQSPVVVEIGVYHGGSLGMWRHYFGESSRIIGIDIEPKCKMFEGPGVEVIIGSQEDRDFLRSLRSQIPPIDILIDDGGHTMGQQIATYEELFDHVQPNGVYLC